MTSADTRQMVERFWQTMNTNDWEAVSRLLHDDYTLEYPQSGERMRGRASFIAINGTYPAAGPWRFAVQRIVADDAGAVSDVEVTAPEVRAHVVSFFELRDGLIARMTEYWPDPFPAAAWRAQWVEGAPRLVTREESAMSEKMTENGAVYLPNSEADYADWFEAHPLGYIINAHKTGAVPMVWHRVGCGHIKPDGVMRFIGGEYLKACATDPGELAVWAKARREPLNVCAHCRTQSANER